jgi:LPXTG-motif cell wall-anchored protein
LKDAYDPKYIVKDKVRATGVTLNKSSLELILGDTAILKASIVPENATLADVVWSSSNEAVVKVDKNGKLTPVTEGTAEVTAKTLDGDFTAKCVVTVKAGILPKTGSVIDYTTLSASGILVMCIGVLVLAAGRSNKETEE